MRWTGPGPSRIYARSLDLWPLFIAERQDGLEVGIGCAG
jgi:hypothetical protein